MSILGKCRCGMGYEVPAEMAGTKHVCPGCGAVLTIAPPDAMASGAQTEGKPVGPLHGSVPPPGGGGEPERDSFPTETWPPQGRPGLQRIARRGRKGKPAAALIVDAANMCAGAMYLGAAAAGSCWLPFVPAVFGLVAVVMGAAALIRAYRARGLLGTLPSPDENASSRYALHQIRNAPRKAWIGIGLGVVGILAAVWRVLRAAYMAGAL